MRITGRVQGVGYRAWALQAASRLNLRGWVRNRTDGSVEALVIGEDDAVARMIEACREGSAPASPMSRSAMPKMTAAWSLARSRHC